MLKIKDDVDLKELEKYGFKYDETDNSYSREHIIINIDDNIYNIKNTRKIYIVGSDSLYIIYDLIKADLVEKV